MKVAVPVWRGRISPVLDVAGCLLVVEVDGRRELARREESLADFSLQQRVARLAQLSVATVICGAVSRPLEMLLTTSGIEVLASVCGEAEEVLEAFREGTLDQARFAMPGCCGRRRRRLRGRRCAHAPRTKGNPHEDCRDVPGNGAG